MNPGHGCLGCGTEGWIESCPVHGNTEIDLLRAEVAAVRGVLNSTVDNLSQVAAENAALKADVAYLEQYRRRVSPSVVCECPGFCDYHKMSNFIAMKKVLDAAIDFEEMWQHAPVMTHSVPGRNLAAALKAFCDEVKRG